MRRFLYWDGNPEGSSENRSVTIGWKDNINKDKTKDGKFINSMMLPPAKNGPTIAAWRTQGKVAGFAFSL
jgi:hypothetical protein